MLIEIASGTTKEISDASEKGFPSLCQTNCSNRITARSAENEAQLPHNVAYWSFTLRGVDVGNFFLRPTKDLETMPGRRVDSINS